MRAATAAETYPGDLIVMICHDDGTEVVQVAGPRVVDFGSGDQLDIHLPDVSSLSIVALS